MKNFKQTQKYIVEFATKKGACSSELSRAKEATTKEDLLSVIRDNLNWVMENGLFNGVNILQYFPAGKLIEFNIGNIGSDNTGLANSGHSNSGNSNSGYSNSGDRNSGNSNSGDSNSGYSNSGNRNSGDRNSGNWNSRYSNSGHRNSGDWNSGDRNSGNRNSGDSNSGYRNSGAFCTDPNPTLVLFDKPTNILVRDWEQSEVVRIMSNIDPTIWVPASIMTAEEKAAHPKWETTDGYLKTITIHEAWSNMWGNLPEEKKQLFRDLPNFDADKFKEITGIDAKQL